MRAIVALAPIGVVFNPGSLESVAIPTPIYIAERDLFLVPRFHAQWLVAHLPSATVHVVPNAWHFAFIDPPSAPTPSEDGDLREDPPGFDRPAFLRRLRSEVADFFDTAPSTSSVSERTLAAKPAGSLQ